MPLWDGVEDASAVASPVWLSRTLKEDPTVAISRSSSGPLSVDATSPSSPMDIMSSLAIGDWTPLRKVDCHALDTAHEEWSKKKNKQQQETTESSSPNGGVDETKEDQQEEEDDDDDHNGQPPEVYIEGGRSTAYVVEGVIRYNLNRGPVRELRPAVWFYKYEKKNASSKGGGGGGGGNGGGGSGGGGSGSGKNGGLPQQPPTKQQLTLEPVLSMEEATAMEELYQRVVQATSSRGVGLDRFLQDEKQSNVLVGKDGSYKITVKIVEGKLKMRKVSSKTGFAGLFFQKGSIDLQRGYGAYSAPGEDDEACLGPVRNLVFLIHGIGEAYFSRDEVALPSMMQELHTTRATVYAKQAQKWRKECDDAVKKGLPEMPKKLNRSEFVLIEWFDRVHNQSSSQMKSLCSTTVPSVPALRAIANDIIFDVIMYQTPHYCHSVLESVTEQIHTIYERFQEIHPDFIRDGGTCTIVAHSLGSVIAWDLLSLLKQDQERQLCNARVVMASPNGTTEMVSKSCGDDDDDEILKGRLSYGPPLLHPVSRTLPFVPRTTVFLGSPLGMFLTIRGAHGIFEDLRIKEQTIQDQHHLEVLQRWEEEMKEREKEEEEKKSKASNDNNNIPDRTRVGSDTLLQFVKLGGGGSKEPPLQDKPLPPPRPLIKASPFTLPTDRLYNIYHPSDPVAYRIEPLLMDPNTAIKALPPAVYLTPPGQNVRLHLKAKLIGDDISNSWNAWLESAAAAFAPSSDATNDAGNANTAASNRQISFPLGGKSHRIDYTLQPGVIDNEYISAVTAHSSYFANDDFQSFLMHILSEEDNDLSTAVEMGPHREYGSRLGNKS